MLKRSRGETCLYRSPTEKLTCFLVRTTWVDHRETLVEFLHVLLNQVIGQSWGRGKARSQDDPRENRNMYTIKKSWWFNSQHPEHPNSSPKLSSFRHFEIRAFTTKC